MSTERRQTILVSIMLVLLICAAGWAMLDALEQRARAQRAADQLALSEALAEQIRRLREQPKVATSQEIGTRQLGRKISLAAEAAGLGTGSIQGVTPRPARRVGRSDYMAKPTTLKLQGVSLGQMAMFLYHISSDSNLTVRDLRLEGRRASPGQTDRLWNGQATITYLIYSPATADSR